MTLDRAEIGLSTALAGDRRARLLDFGFSQSPVIFYVADLEPSSRVLFIAPDVEAITGYEPSALLEDPLFARGRIHPDDLSAHLDAVRGLAPRNRGSRLRNIIGIVEEPIFLIGGYFLTITVKYTETFWYDIIIIMLILIDAKSVVDFTNV